MTDPLLIFTPSGRRGQFPAGTVVLDAARSLGVDIDSVCGGRGICGRCQVRPMTGSFPKHGIDSSAGHLSAPGTIEADYERTRAPLMADCRLACAATLQGDLVADVPPESQVHRQVVRKGLARRAFTVDPVVRLHYVEVEPPQLASPSGDLGRLFEALEREWSLTGLAADLHVVRDLQPALAKGAHQVTVAVHGGKQVVAVWPGFQDRALGVAVDVGSTTIAGHLADLERGEVLASAGVMNPQIRFGEDLMSRVSYAMLHDDGAVEMTAAVRTAVAELVGTLVSQSGEDPNHLLELAVVGNPIMHHLLLGIDPVPLGSAPFALATDRAVQARASDIGLDGINAGARLYVLPCIAGHVGADTAGMLLAETPYRSKRMTLLVDVGTNAEIVLGDARRLLAASSPTGPAFEGAQISSGQRAAPGAIERVRIDPETLEPRIRVIGDERWSDEPGFGAAALATGEGDLPASAAAGPDGTATGAAVTGICGSGIVEAIAELYLAGIITPDGIIDGGMAERTSRVVADGRTFSYLLHDGSPRILVTQNDVRAIQLAKAALYAGARLLMDHLGVDAVEQVRLAGAFGSQIDPLHAMVLGLIPDCPLDQVEAAGNAAGTGALIALLSANARREVEAQVRRVEKIETAVEPRFQEHFVAAMALPHGTAPTPNLATAVALPEPKARDHRAAGGGERRGRRRVVTRPRPSDAGTPALSGVEDER